MAKGLTDIGVCSWSLKPRDPHELIKHLKEVGVERVQLALAPLLDDPAAWDGCGNLLAEAGVLIVSGMFGTVGEDYTSHQTIRATGGIVPDVHWEENWARIQHFAAIAAHLNLRLVSFHAGFIPESGTGDPASGKAAAFDTLVERIRRIADLFADRFGGVLLLETGQETADTLGGFLDAVDRDNVGVNFDPANMLLYGMGDPIEALRTLMPRVQQVHLKDAAPSPGPGIWGREMPLGQGEVDWPAFVEVLGEANYAGPAVIEREGGDHRVADVREAAKWIRSV